MLDRQKQTLLLLVVLSLRQKKNTLHDATINAALRANKTPKLLILSWDPNDLSTSPLSLCTETCSAPNEGGKLIRLCVARRIRGCFYDDELPSRTNCVSLSSNKRAPNGLYYVVRGGDF